MGDRDTQIVRTTTWSVGPGCHGGCGVLAHIKGGKLGKIEGDRGHPWNQGHLCVRVLAMTQYVEHSDRLTKPQASFVPGPLFLLSTHNHQVLSFSIFVDL